MPEYDMPRPRFRADDPDQEKQIRKIISWLLQQDEKIRYILNNLDEENFSEGLTTQISEALNIATSVNGVAQKEEIDALTGRVRRAETRIEQDEEILRLKASEEYVDEAIEGIDEFHAESQYSEIELTKDRAKITTPEFIVNILREGAEETSLQIDEDGAVMDYLSVGKKLAAPNMAEKYMGKTSLTVGAVQGADFQTLQAAFDTLNDRVVAQDVTIRLVSDIEENAELKGVMGGGSVRLTGYHEGNPQHVLTGSVEYIGCACRLYVNDLTMLGAGYGHAILAQACMYLDINGVIFDGQGLVSCIQAIGGSTIKIQDAELYNARSLIDIANSTLYATDCQGGQCTNYLEADHCIWTWEGDRPTGAYLESGASIYKDNSTGSQSGIEPTPSTDNLVTERLNATTACRGNNWNNDGRWQGAVGSVNYKTCMWFDLRNLANKEVTSASLTLTRLRAGGSGAAKLHLYNTPLSGASGDPLENKTDRGEIGEILNDERMAFPVPAAAVQQMIDSGGGLMLYQNEESRAVGYSKNYASFGQSGSDVPVLTVTYK